MDLDPSKVKAATLGLAGPLSRRVGEHKVIDDPDLLAGLAGDESAVEPRAPDLALRATSSEDIAVALELAVEHGVPVTPRAGGTGKSGGAIPIHGGLVIDVMRLKRIVEIDRDNLLAVVEPGVITGEFQDAVEEQGLFYPPDPNSLETCTLGGNVAHNAGGPRAFKYGVTRQYALGLECVIPGGRRMRTGRRTIKGVAGYDLTALLVGSEGTLGVFTELTLRLIRKPPHIATLLVRLPDDLTAARAVSKIVAAGLVPRVLEFVDGALVECLRSAGAAGIPEDTGALLLTEVDGPGEEIVESDAARLAELCEGEGAIDVLMARHVGERRQLWAARRVLSDAVKERARFKIAEDVVVPRAEAVRLLEGLKRLGEKNGVLVASYGHAGDGNYHVNVLWDDPGIDPEPIISAIFDLTLGLGGTISGEHGIGAAKIDYLPKDLDPTALTLMKQLKGTFDPKGLLNPGKIFR